MGKKIFVSYKHKDRNVKQLGRSGSKRTTARDYVEDLIGIFKEDGEIYKGEDDQDRSQLVTDTIKEHLKDKIHDSSITLVLISPNMKEQGKSETDQLIHWEVSYSLKEIERKGKISEPNAIVAVVLPDGNGKYGYYMEEHTCTICEEFTRSKIGRLFQILADNMFNKKTPEFSDCTGCRAANRKLYTGEPSYILDVKWADFIDYKDHYLERAAAIRDDRKNYEITEDVEVSG